MSYNHRRAVGDILSKFAVQLTREGVPINLTGYTVVFTMSAADGSVKVPESAAVVTNALLGYVEYDFIADDVDTAGDFTGFFRVYGSGEPDTYPASPEGISIEVFDPSPVIIVDSGFTTAEFLDLAKAPKRTRTAEGTVEERSIDDLIKADRYAKSQDLDAPPWGIRVARTKPPGTTGT